MTTYLNALKAQTNLTRTENGAVTNQSTLDPIVDFFSLAGAMRNNTKGAADLFENAFSVDKQTAVRTLFYLRDVRGGQGERDIFRAGWTRLCQIDAVAASKVIQHIPEYGRWDDLWSTTVDLSGSLEQVIAKQLKADLEAYESSPTAQVSLLAKWLPSEVASSQDTKRLARRLAERLGYGPPAYRRVLSKLRKRIHLLEQDMSAKRWDDIDFSKLPGQAHRKHIKAFRRHVPERYQAYLDSVEKGEAKINTSTLYPYELYNMANEPAAGVMWDNLPDYTNGTDALVMADVSGSMVRPYDSANPIAVSVSLALYFAERNKGAFKGYFMTFSGNPQLVQVRGTTFAQRVQNIARANWAMNTDMLAAFRAILAAARQAHEPPPPVLYIISDMEFDLATGHRGYYGHNTPQDTIFRTAKREFEQAGFELPHVVFWNVAARNMQAPATILDGQVSLVSGCSPTIFAQTVQGKTPRQLVDDVVNGERYSRIVI